MYRERLNLNTLNRLTIHSLNLYPQLLNLHTSNRGRIRPPLHLLTCRPYTEISKIS